MVEAKGRVDRRIGIAGGVFLGLCGLSALTAKASATIVLHVPAGTVDPQSVVTSVGVPNPGTLGASTYSFTLSRAYSPSDRVRIEADGTASLCPNCSADYVSNPAGVIVGPETTNTGNHPGEFFGDSDIPHYGAITIGNDDLGYWELFEVDAAAGLGSSVPPTLVRRCAPLSSVFNFPGFTGLPSGTVLHVRIADSDNYNNSGTIVVRDVCPVDFNCDGTVDGDDLGDFVNGYFQAPPDERCDYNEDGTIDSDDLGDFINAYFNPPC